MPYVKVKKGSQTCVHKKGDDGKPTGSSLGCHDTPAQADKQIAAINAREKAKMVAGMMERQDIEEHVVVATPPRIFTDEDRARAVEIAQRIGATEAAKQIGVERTTIAKWVKSHPELHVTPLTDGNQPSGITTVYVPDNVSFDVTTTTSPVTSAGESNDQIPEDSPPTSRFELVFREGEQTVDGRIIGDGAVNFDRDPPLPLMLLTRTTSGHADAQLAGSVEELSREPGGLIVARGTYDLGSDVGQEAARLVGDRILNTISPDFAPDAEMDVEVVEYDADGTPLDAVLRMTSGTVIGVTIVPMPALSSARIVMADDEEGVMALRAMPTTKPRRRSKKSQESAMVAAGMNRPPAEWFDNPSLPALTPLTVTDDGHVYGHIAPWQTCHIGHPGVCLVAQPSRTNYAHFRTGAIYVAGQDDPVPVGQITLTGGHAPIEDAYGRAIPLKDVVKHYDDTNSAVADVAAYDDAHGIAVAGALRPGVTDSQIRALQASSVSGDWRRIGGHLELVAICACNVPGYPIPRAHVASGEQTALVAAGAPAMSRPEPWRAELDELRTQVIRLAASTRPIIRDRILSRVHNGSE